jgi:predicted PurR-regulated permease PerM
MERRNPMSLKTRDIVRILSLIFGFYILVRLLWVAHPVIFLFFLGVLFGLPLAQGADWLENRRVPRPIGVAVILIAFFGLMTGGWLWLSPVLRMQSRELEQRLPEAMDKIDAWLGHRAGGVLGILFNEESATDSVRIAAADRPDSLGSTPAAQSSTETGVVADSTRAVAPAPATSATVVRTMTKTREVEVGGNLRREITRQFRGAQHSFLRVLTSTFAISGAFLLVVFIAAYIAVDPALYHGGVLEMVPRRERERAAITLTRLATTLRRWLVTQLIAMVVIGAVTTLFLFAIHVRAALPLGILAGILKFIPIIGSIFAAVPAMAMAFIDSPHKALVVGVGYFVIQFVENHVLVPVLMKAGINLPPALTLGIQALMSVLFGFIGLLVAVPLLAALLTIVRTMSASEMREISAEADAAVAAATLSEHGAPPRLRS